MGCCPQGHWELPTLTVRVCVLCWVGGAGGRGGDCELHTLRREVNKYGRGV